MIPEHKRAAMQRHYDHLTPEDNEVFRDIDTEDCSSIDDDRPWNQTIRRHEGTNHEQHRDKISGRMGHRYMDRLTGSSS